MNFKPQETSASVSGDYSRKDTVKKITVGKSVLQVKVLLLIKPGHFLCPGCFS